MLKLLQCEYFKLKRSRILLIGLLGTWIVPVFVVGRSAIHRRLWLPKATFSLFTLYDDGLMLLMLLFGPMVLTIYGAWIIGREYTDGTLKNLFAIPVSRSFFIAGKMLFFAISAFLFMLISWAEILGLAVLCRFCFPAADFTDLTVPSALFFLLRMLFGGVLLAMIQMPFLSLAVRTKGFVAPMIAVTAIILINVVLSNSVIAGFYPWSAAYLLVTNRFSGQSCPKAVSAIIITAVCLFGITASLARFQKDEAL